MKELITRLGGDRGEVEVFLTGGAAPGVAQLLGPNVRYVPHLTLAGIALSRSHAARRDRS